MKNTQIILYVVYNILQSINAQFMQSDPVRLEIHEVVNCKEDSSWKWSQDVRILNETHAIATVDADINSGFDDTVTVSGEFKQWTNNNWKYLIKLNKKKACSTVKQYAGPLFVDVCKEIGLSSGNCPIPKGQYGIKDKIIDYSKTPLSKFLVGRFKAKVSGTSSTKVVLFCVEVELSAIKRT